MDGYSGPLFPITGLIVMTPLAIAATKYAFAKDEVFTQPAVAKIVGTSNPKVARTICIIAIPVAWAMSLFSLYYAISLLLHAVPK